MKCKKYEFGQHVFQQFHPPLPFLQELTFHMVLALHRWLKIHQTSRLDPHAVSPLLCTVPSLISSSCKSGEPECAAARFSSGF